MPLPLLVRVVMASARPQAVPLVRAAGLGSLAVVVDLARPWPLAFAVDHVLDDAADPSRQLLLGLAAAAIVVLSAASGLIEMGSQVLAERSAERVGARLRSDLFERSLSLSLRWHDRTRSGEVVSRLTTDVGRVLDTLVALSIGLAPEALRLGVIAVVLAMLDVKLAVAGLAVVPVLAMFAVRQRRLVRAAQQEARTQSGRLVATATDMLRNVRAVQAFGRPPRTSAVFGAHNGAVLEANVQAVTAEARWAPIADTVLAVGSGLVLLVGGREVIGGQLSTGELLVVMSYASALYTPVRGLARLSGLVAKGAVSAARIHDVLACTDRVPDRPNPRPAPPVIPDVRFDDVRFGYRPGRPVLNGFDLTIPAGQTVALLGPSGCGKSTVLSLLLRLYDVDAGSIRLHGVDIRDIEQADLRRRIAYVPQDPWLFDTTIADNIAIGSPVATRHGVLAAARAALVDEFAADLPDGYATVIGEQGSQLSGGQRRRIALARATISDAPLILLDEPTASLDAASAASVVQAIRQATRGRTVLLVTHDTELAALADQRIGLDRRTPVGVGLPAIRVREEVTS